LQAKQVAISYRFVTLTVHLKEYYDKIYWIIWWV